MVGQKRNSKLHFPVLILKTKGYTILKANIVNLINTSTVGTIEIVHINRVSVLSELHLEKIYLSHFLSPVTKQTVRNDEVSTLSGCM